MSLPRSNSGSRSIYKWSRDSSMTKGTQRLPRVIGEFELSTSSSYRRVRVINEFELSTSSSYQRVRVVGEFELSTSLSYQRVWVINEFELSASSRYRRVRDIDEFELSTIRVIWWFELNRFFSYNDSSQNWPFLKIVWVKQITST